MTKLTGAERKYLRGQAHSLKPLVRIGKQGLTEGALQEIDAVLTIHELIKVQAPGTKEEKEDLSRRIEESTGAADVGRIGHVIILYRQQPDPEKRRIEIPRAESLTPPPISRRRS